MSDTLNYSLRGGLNRSAPEPNALLLKGRVIRVTMDVVLPADATRAEIEEWIGLWAGRGSMSADSPLADSDPEPLRDPMLEDIGVSTDYFEVRDRWLSATR